MECDNYMVILMFEKLQLCRLAANVKNNMGHTPLHLSAINNNVDGAEKILDAGAVVDSYDAVSIPAVTNSDHYQLSYTVYCIL